MLSKLLVVTVVMFGFGYAMVPFYEKICEVNGLNNLLNPDESARDSVQNTQVDKNRTVTIEFDANTQNLLWKFKPGQTSIQVHPGELINIKYLVQNEQDKPVTGQAIPSYGPQLAGQYFKKLECFCFSMQTLAAKEQKEMPVVFVIDPALPKDINTITLSYTFFEVAGSKGVSPAPRGVISEAPAVKKPGV